MPLPHAACVPRFASLPGGPGKVGWLGVERNESQKRWSNVIFGIVFLVSLALFGRIMLPFTMPVLLGGLLVVLLLPAHDALCRALGGRRALSAGVSTVAVLAGIVVPLGFTTYFVAREVLAAAEIGRALLDDPALRENLAAKLPEPLQRFVLGTSENGESQQALLAALSSTAALFKELLGMGTGLAVDVFLMSVSMYYFFLDGRRLFAEGTRLIPMERRYFDAFAQEFKDVAYAIVYGNTLTAVVQGALGLIGLWIAGVPHPLVWGVTMALLALVPVGGTALVWLPISGVLLLSGRVVEGLFLLCWGALVVSTVDNLLRPRLCGRRMALHPLLVFLSMFGGLAVFGMMGLLVGPLIASLFMAVVRIYRRDFLGVTRQAVEKFTHTARVAGS